MCRSDCFLFQADIHHASPLVLDSPSLPPSSASSLPPYRAPPHPVPAHLYHPRDRLARPGPLLPPVDEDEYVPLEEKEQDLHRQLLNLPLQSDVGSHDSHNDSGYSTRLGASAGPSPSLSGKYQPSTNTWEGRGGEGGGGSNKYSWFRAGLLCFVPAALSVSRKADNKTSTRKGRLRWG